MTAAPMFHPGLGLPMELLHELASVDWHAGHRDVPHPSQPHPNPRVPAACACAEPSVVGDFAVRFLTGQAQMSSTRDGTGALMASPMQMPTEAPRGIRAGDTSKPVLAGLVVHGTVSPAEHHPLCENNEPHKCLTVEITGVGVLGHEKLDDDDVLELLSKHLLRLASQRPGGERATDQT